MMKILKIEETTFKHTTEYPMNFDGFVITTTKQEIKLGIENGQACCEDWGYFLTNDNPEDFIGASILSVDVVDEILDKSKLIDIHEGDTMFVNIETDRGTLQFTAYNEHNGYYGHDAIFIANGKDEVSVL